MSPVTHFFAGWMLAATADLAGPVALTRREKALIVAAAVAPDLDGLGIIPELLTRHTSHPLLWFSRYHHSLHTLAFALVCTAAAWVIAGPLVDFAWGPVIRGRPGRPTHPWTTAILVFLSFHLHLLCDLLGSRGPDGDQWPIPYLRPFSNALQLTWHGQWALNGWQNFAITGALLIATLWIAWRFQTSPLELVSSRANRTIVRTLRQRFPTHADSGKSESHSKSAGPDL
ncbi:MAG TPA: metal-dependent hydrolase [Candidatus Angelobacter sp.]|nr:metal-dependent hydrolase [Candidatus Angelobacter sp.]